MPVKPYAQKMIDSNPVFRDIADLKETVWINDKYLPLSMIDGVCQLIVSDEDIDNTEKRLRRFAPYIKKCFSPPSSASPQAAKVTLIANANNSILHFFIQLLLSYPQILAR